MMTLEESKKNWFKAVSAWGRDNPETLKRKEEYLNHPDNPNIKKDAPSRAPAPAVADTKQAKETKDAKVRKIAEKPTQTRSPEKEERKAMGARLRQARKKSGFQAQTLSKRFGWSRAALSVAESGGAIADGKLGVICEFLNVSKDWVRTGKGEMELDGGIVKNDEHVSTPTGEDAQNQGLKADAGPVFAISSIAKAAATPNRRSNGIGLFVIARPCGSGCSIAYYSDAGWTEGAPRQAYTEAQLLDALIRVVEKKEFVHGITFYELAFALQFFEGLMAAQRRK